MSVKYLAAPGEIIPENNLKIPKAKEVLAALKNLPFFNFVECRRLSDLNDAEVIVFDTAVQVGQRTVHDIRYTERIAVSFDANDNSMPEVLALREDFPVVPHINLRAQEKPRSLCLYEQTYDEIKLRWTATFFLDQIRLWLALTAKGELHGIDQPLEPLLSETSNYLIFPFDSLKRMEDGNNQFMIVRRIKSEWIVDDAVSAFIPISLWGKSQVTGVISKQPRNVSELHNFLINAGIELLSELRDKLKAIKEQRPQDIFKTPLVLITYLPKKRTETSETEVPDVWAFLINTPISNIGKEIGIWEVTNGDIGYLIKPDLSMNGSNLEIELLNTVPSFTMELASIVNGQKPSIDVNILLIGAGALGSQILINLIREGIGNWTIVDDDCLLPHNLARHALSGFCIGRPKASMLAKMANSIIQGKAVAKAINTNVLHPNASASDLSQALQEAKVIMDVSTSVPVARYIARDISGDARRMSLFLNPSGSDVIVMTEDKNRKISLDCLEMHYYRYLINDPALENHLKHDEGPVRYARSCRDISSTISQDLVALHAAICSRKIKEVLSEHPESSITIWSANIADMSVKRHDVPVYKTIQKKYGEWTICFDNFIMNKIHTARQNSLPNETGGVLIGSFDMLRKIVYVVDTILSPPDSSEKPDSFERGREGLKERLSKIEEITLNNLTYIGEWHSHPHGSHTTPSTNDMGVFSWLLKIMSIVGLPPLMLIAGDRDESWHIEKI